MNEENAYRHALSQGSRKSFLRPKFDMYALGIVLIELGLWSSIKDILQTIRRKIDFSLPKNFVNTVFIAMTHSTIGDTQIKEFLFKMTRTQTRNVGWRGINRRTARSTRSRIYVSISIFKSPFVEKHS